MTDVYSCFAWLSSLTVVNVPFTFEQITKASGQRSIYDNDARALKEALRDSLPGGTYFRLCQLLQED